MVSGLEQLRADDRPLLSAQQSVGHTGSIPLARLGTFAEEWLRFGGVVQVGEASQQFRFVSPVYWLKLLTLSIPPQAA